MTLEATCTRCGKPVTPTPEDIRRGRWRRCPPCRDGPTVPTGTRRHHRTEQSLTGANNASEVSSKINERTDR